MTTLSRSLALILIGLLLSGCYLSRSAELPDELVRTWDGGTVVVPVSRYVSGGRDLRGTMDRLEPALETLDLGTRIPAVVFLHGCNGLHGGYRVDLDFLRDKGYAVIAPDSFSRDYKPRSCDWRSKSAGFHPGVIGFRLAEAEYAIDRVKRFPWVDPDRVVLIGQSEGGMTTANYTADGIAAKVVLGWTCQIPWPPLWGLDGPADLPVLSVVSDGDRWFQRWFVRGHCGEDMDGFEDATSVVLNSSTHHVMRLSEAREAVGSFLDRVAPTPLTERAVSSESGG